MRATNLISPGGCALSITVPRGDELAPLLLDGLRRDAFVMEIGAYRQPVLPQETEFPTVFAILWERLRTFLGETNQPSLTCIIQAQYLDGTFETLVGVQPSFSQLFLAKWSHSDPLDLANVRQPLSFVRDELATAPYLDGQLRGVSEIRGDDVAVARYFVRSVLEPADTSKASNGDLSAMYKLEPSARQRGFVNIDSFAPSSPIPTRASENAYYFALLAIATEHPVTLSPSDLAWFEFLHTSFQVSWGFPLLAKQREELVTLKQINDSEQRNRERLQGQIEQMEYIRAVAKELSHEIHTHIVPTTYRLLGALDPGMMLDNGRVFEMFDANEMAKGSVFWRDSSSAQRVTALHDADENDDEVNRRFVATAIHLMLGTPEFRHCQTSAELIAQAMVAVDSESRAQSDPGLMALLHAALDSPYRGHGLLKEICFAPRDTKRKVSLFAVAVRLLLVVGLHNRHFRVNLKDRGGNSISFTRSDFGQSAVLARDAAWYKLPALPGIKGVRHVDWIRPLAMLVGNGLQRLKEDHGVQVSTVDLMENAGSCTISCHITEVAEQPGAFARVIAQLDGAGQMTAGECSTSNLLAPYHILHKQLARPELTNRITPTINKATQRLELTIA